MKLEEMTDDQLRELAVQKMVSSQPAPNLEEMSDDQLREMAVQKMMAQPLTPQQSTPVDYSEEADLGLITRGRYALEPIESQREAILVEQFGRDNVRKDPSTGELLVFQRGKFIPANAPGFSVADVAEIAASAPEAIGAGAGAVAGMGPGSIPGAMLGAGVGAAARQALSSGISALAGTPDVTTAPERIGDVAFSTALGGAGAVAGKALKSAAKPLVKKFDKFLPKIGIDDLAESAEGSKIKAIAKQEGLIAPTPAQVAGGRIADVEKKMRMRPFIGAPSRKRFEQQTEQIKKNIASEIGDFIDVDEPLGQVGSSIKDSASTTIQAVKEFSGNLFDEVAEQGRDVALPGKAFFNDYKKAMARMGFFDINGNPQKFTSRSGLTRDQFKRLQGIFGDLYDDILETTKPVKRGIGQKFTDIDMNTLNKMKQFLDGNIKEGSQAGFDDTILIEMKNKFLDMTEKGLKARSPEIAKKFKTARKSWREYLELRDAFEKGGKGKGSIPKNLNLSTASDEKVLRSVFSDKGSVKALKRLTGENDVKKAGYAFIRDGLSKKIKSSQQNGAGAALTWIKDRREVITEAIGKQSYDKLRRNLFYAQEIGIPLNPSQTKYTQLLSEINLNEIVASVVEAAELKGRKLSRPAIKKVNEALENAISSGAKAAVIGGQGGRQEFNRGLRRGN